MRTLVRGNTKREAMRVLKRNLSNVVYRQIMRGVSRIKWVQIGEPSLLDKGALTPKTMSFFFSPNHPGQHNPLFRLYSPSKLKSISVAWNEDCSFTLCECESRDFLNVGGV